MTTNSESVKVLHVDDEPSFADMVATFLERYDSRLTVTTVGSPAEGIRLIDDDIDCVVSDYDMPDVNGLKFLESVKQIDENMPFILFTGKGSEEIASEAISAGVTDYLQKGGTEKYTVLANRVINAVEQYRAKRSAERTERQLREEKRVTDQTLDTLDDIFYVIDQDGTLDRWNDTLLEVSGYDAEEVAEMDAVEFFPEDERDRVANAISTTLETGSVDIEAELRTKAGRCLPYEFTGSRLIEPDGTIRGLVGVGRDVSRRNQRERRIQRQERRFEAVFNDPNILVGLLSPSGTVLDINQTAMEYVGTELEDITGTKFWNTPWWDTNDQVQRDVQGWLDRAANGEYVEYETIHTNADGDEFTVSGTFRPVPDATGETGMIIVSGRDITDFEESKRGIKQRNERMNEFAGILSHDLQTPLSTAEGRLELALSTGELEHAKEALKAVKRVNSMREEVVEVLKSGEIVTSAENINLAEVAETVWQMIDGGVDGTLTIADRPVVEGDRSAIRRFFENAFNNAVEHGGSGTTVRLGAIPNGFYIEDDGPGIDPEIRADVFTAGFSTKGGSNGTGLGMTSLEQIVSAHGWEIGISDGEHLEGARFEIDVT